MRSADGQVKCEIPAITLIYELTVDTGNLSNMNINIAVML